MQHSHLIFVSGAAIVAALFGTTSGCIGDIGGESGLATISDDVAVEVSVSGMRRLSVAEYQQTVFDLLGIQPLAANELLPADNLGPFDNDIRQQTASEALIKGAELLAGDIADEVMQDPAVREAVVGCAPSVATDDTCLRSFITRFGRMALRRTLTSAEVDKFAALSKFGDEAGDFWVSAGAVLRAMLQHPEFLYRIEIGEPVAGHDDIRRLNDNELATRMSYFLIGSTPPDWLISDAESGALSNAEGVAKAADTLFADPRARTRVARFHAMWLSYSTLSREGIAEEMHLETEALLNRIIFDERRPWIDVLTATDTWLTPALAEHYGLSAPADPAGAWVAYVESGRKGLFSHGTFLSAVPKFGDTSPTQRGKLVRERLFCEKISLPPPNLNVNVDEPPASADPNACKPEQYYMAKEEACKSCHAQMDPIGFGLENFDSSGRFRETEINRPDCVIDGQGELAGVGTFNGPSGLADLAVQSGEVEACVVSHLYQFAAGRTELDEFDARFIDRVARESTEGGALTFDAFIHAYVSSESFRFRREETTK